MKALLLRNSDGIRASITDISMADLPKGEVLLQTQYSSLNYKDALAITGEGKIIRTYPFIPGIDVVGKVVESKDKRYQIGDEVIITGWGMGETHWGGLAEFVRVPSDWIVPLPKDFTSLDSMIVGTAGLTAMLCVMALEDQGITPDQGEIVVTGASGGVGSFAVYFLSKLGYQVCASTGKEHEYPYLQMLGATRILDRSYLSGPTRPLERQEFAGAIDTVGGSTLGNLFSRIHYYGAVVACGLAQDQTFKSTVFPFILRGVKLVGVESVIVPFTKRMLAWERIASISERHVLQEMSQVITLDQVVETCDRILDGKVRGRTIVQLR